MVPLPTRGRAYKNCFAGDQRNSVCANLCCGGGESLWKAISHQPSAIRKAFARRSFERIANCSRDCALAIGPQTHAIGENKFHDTGSARRITPLWAFLCAPPCTLWLSFRGQQNPPQRTRRSTEERHRGQDSAGLHNFCFSSVMVGVNPWPIVFYQ